MFKSILPLLAGCKSLTLIIVPGANDELTVTVIPTAKQDDATKAILNTPVSLTSTAEELDAQFASLMAKHATTRTSLEEQLEATDSILDAAKNDSAAKAAGAVKKAGKATAATPAAPTAAPDDDDDGQGSGAAPAAATPAAPAEELNLFA